MSEEDKYWVDKRKKVDAAVDALSEHFDTVQVYVSEYRGDDDGKTYYTSNGAGNFLARLGQVRLWVLKAEAEDLEDEED